MAANLTELVQQLHAISNGEGRDPSGLRTDRPYQDALATFWRGDARGAADQVSTHVANDPGGGHRFASYRLWIEALAELGDKPSLRYLAEHLFMRGQAEPDDVAVYVSLRGVIHLELDEPNAAKLMARAVREDLRNPYGLELAQLVDNRFGTPELPLLCRCAARIDDFFHWQTLARGMLATQDEEAINEVMQHVRTQFRGAPMPLIFEYHRCIESGYFAGAAVVAQRLTELFPRNVDYAYYHAYSLFEDGDYPSARRILTDVVREHGDTDAELVGLLGHCHAKLGDPEQAAHHLRTAVQLLKAEGLPSSHVSLELANVEDEMRGDQLDPALEMPRGTRVWLVNLSARRYLELQTASENSVDRLLRPMGKEPRPGDYCFFAVPDESDEDQEGRAKCKVIAIYAVDSDPIWHPTYRYHTALKLVSRPPLAIPVDVDVEADDGSAGRAIDKDDPYAFGVYELDLGALDVITEAVRQHNEGTRERRTGGVRSNRTTG